VTNSEIYGENFERNILTRGLSRREFLHLVGAGAGAMTIPGLLAACGSQQQTGGVKGKTVTVAVGSFMSSGVTMFKDAWEKKTGGKVEVVEIPFGDLYQRLFTSFNTGAGQFDVAVYAANWIPEFAQQGHILSLEKYYSQKNNWDAVLDKTKQLMYVGGERYSVPMDGDVIIGYYRRDALENEEYKQRFKGKYKYDLTPPTAWEQYRDIAEFFTGWDWAKSGSEGWGVLEAQGPKDVGPYILTSRVAVYAAHPDLPGSLFFNPDTMEPSIDNPGWIQGLEDWAEIKKFGPSEMATYGGGDMRGNFVAGDYALGIDWADVGVIAQDEQASTVKGKLGYFVLPGSQRVWNIETSSWDKFDSPQQAPYLGWGGWHGSVAADSDVPDAAWDFLNFIDSSKNSFKAVTTPGTARNPYRAPHFEDVEAWTTAPVKYEDPGPYLKAQQESMGHPNAQFDLRIPKAGRYFEVLDNWMQRTLSGDMSAKDALSNAANEWRQITEETGLEQQKKLYRELYGLDEEG
jgi:multiple sugar transport system substrate-binding protein